MLKWKYVFLILALIELGIGFSDARPTAFFYLGRPIGAILFGLYLITQFLEKESTLDDEQQRAGQPEQKQAQGRKPSSAFRPEAEQHPSFTAAHSH